MAPRKHVAVLLALVLSWTALVPAVSAEQSAPPREQPLQEKLIEIPTGSLVEVKLANKQKLRGKLGAVTETGFEVQTVRGGKIVNETYALDQVRSVKHVEKGMGTGTKIVLGGLAGIGVFFLVLIAVAASGSWG